MVTRCIVLVLSQQTAILVLSKVYIPNLPYQLGQTGHRKHQILQNAASDEGLHCLELASI